MTTHTKAFYQAIAQIKAVDARNGVILIKDLKEQLGIDYVAAAQLKDELVAAGILREWDDEDLKGLAQTNINWPELDRY